MISVLLIIGRGRVCLTPVLCMSTVSLVMRVTARQFTHAPNIPFKFNGNYQAWVKKIFAGWVKIDIQFFCWIAANGCIVGVCCVWCWRHPWSCWHHSLSTAEWWGAGVWRCEFESCGGDSRSRLSTGCPGLQLQWHQASLSFHHCE